LKDNKNITLQRSVI